MSAHTPGPWVVFSHEKAIGVTMASGKRPFDVALTYYDGVIWSSDRTREESEANARLIAAAPDLLKACQKALGLLPTAEDAPHEWIQKQIRFIESATAKAEGK